MASREELHRPKLRAAEDNGHQAPKSLRKTRQTEPGFEPFTVRQYPTSIYDKPHMLLPLQLLDRSQIPLSFLDTDTRNSTLPPTNRLFSANIPKLFDLTSSQHSSGPHPVLLATLQQEASLYVVEPVQKDVYALCKLASWVTVDMFGKEIFSSPTSKYTSAAPVAEPYAKEWWAQSALKRKPESLGSIEFSKTKRTKLSILRPVLPPATTRITDPPQGPMSPKSVEPACNMDHMDIAIEMPAPPSPEEVLETLTRQYLETLYASRTSLAFFAKGPLSRARAAFTASSGTSCTPVELSSFLRSMVFKVELLNQKYRTKLPDIVRGLPPMLNSDDEQAAVSVKRRRKVKVPKMDKEGIYAMEDTFVRRWWYSEHGNLEQIDSQETAEARLKRRAADLQTRETLAQIVLILETLALESTGRMEPPVVETIATTIQAGDDASAVKPKRKAKKAQDLDILLDLLTDKLSIWQSVEHDGFMDEEKGKQPPAAPVDASQPADRDLLSQFCTEVVVPFFKARVPKQAALVSQKLIGKAMFSPEKRSKQKAPRSKSKEADARSKDAAKRQRRTLQKSVSDGNLLGRPPSLARSATDSFAIPRLKREASEISMSSIPFKDPPSRTSREPSVHMRHLSRRQVDLNAIAAATESKLKKKARVEEELREAISTLKKPNRSLAVKELVENSDQRNKATTTSKKSRPTVSRGNSNNKTSVQIHATPKHPRKVDHFSQPACLNYPEESIPTSTPLIPSSGHRPSTKPQAMSQPIFMPNREDMVAATPSRPGQRFSGPFAVPGTAGAGSISKFRLGSVTMPSATAGQRSTITQAGIEETPTRGIGKLAPFPSTSVASAGGGQTKLQFLTPAKPKASVSVEDHDIAATPLVARTTSPNNSLETVQLDGIQSSPPILGNEPMQEGQGNIYDALGWNDDDGNDFA